MTLMRRHDPQQQEDGFRQLLPHAGEHLDELLAEFDREPDHGLRCWLLELIAAARSPCALPVFVEHLHSTDESLRSWSVHGLRLLDTPQARQALYEARANGQIS